MKGTQNSVLIALGITLLFTPACVKKVFLEQGPGAGHHFGQKDKREFQVYIYVDPADSSKCLVDWPIGTLWKANHHTVRWFSDDNAQYTIDFNAGTHTPNKSPFQNGATFSVAAGGNQSSGQLDPNAPAGYYDFAIHAGPVQGTVCKPASDPGYYVK